MRKIFIILTLVTHLALATTSESNNEYNPSYIYGSQPYGSYIGGFSQGAYNGIFIPGSGANAEYYPQSGVPMGTSQYIQGQEQLLRAQSIDKQKRRQAEKQIEEELTKEYHRQINSN